MREIETSQPPALPFVMPKYGSASTDGDSPETIRRARGPWMLSTAQSSETSSIATLSRLVTRSWK